MWSLERRDSLERLALPGQVPVLQELLLVEFGPLENVSPRSWREISMDNCKFYLTEISCSPYTAWKCGVPVLIVEHSDDDAEEP